MDIPAPEPIQYRDFLDTGTIRSNIFDNAIKAVQTSYPIENERFKLAVTNPHYESKAFTLADEKKAILSRNNLDWKLKGTWQLIDKQSGKVVDQKDTVIARVPYMTERGTFINNGNEYTVAGAQQRLRPGVYARRKENGELESHFNIIPGTGRSFHLYMEPATGVFKVNVGQANVPALPLLKALGASDQQIAKTLGPQLYAANVLKASKGGQQAVEKLFARFADARTFKAHEHQPEAGLRAVFGRMKLDPDVVRHNLGLDSDQAGADTLLAAAAKLLKIHKGEIDSDDRDSQSNLSLHTPEDLFAERIQKDAGGMAKKLLWKATYTGNLKHVPSSALSGQLQSLLITSGLAQPLSEINPIDILDQLSKVSRLGEGGISSSDSVPDETRNVHPSQAGFVDPVRGPESGNIGVDARLAIGTYRGSDSQLYRDLVNVRTGQVERVSNKDAVRSVLAFPGELEDKRFRRVRALVDGKIRYVDRRSVKYAIANPEEMFTLSSNLVPGYGSVKGGRLLMGAKFAVQALPIANGEAPLVRSATPGGDTFEKLLGSKMGVVTAPGEGRVVAVSPEAVTVRYADGKTQTHQLYNNHPFNQKSLLHSTPLVAAGDPVRPGQVLAKSNYSDAEGNLAMGVNARVAYLPYSSNYEDAVVISQSMADRMRSEHMTQHKYDVGDGSSVSRRSFLSLFPSKFNRDQLSTIGEDGVVRPGTVVREGDPLVLAHATRKPQAGATLHRSPQSYTRDESVTWDSKNQGVVTDVWRDKDGVKVAVKHYAPTGVGDKLVGRYGNKGLVSRVVPDEQMPRDAQDRPFDILYNPLGIISRVNPSLLGEVLLGKVARKVGKPYALRAFNQDLAEFALSEARKNGVPETESVFDPVTNRKLNDIYTGETFVMKLYHTAEGKQSGRSTGSYTSEGQPAKGGSEGAKRVGGLDTLALVAHGVPAVLQDAKLVRGQRNDEWWARFRAGLPTPTPKTPVVYDKFMSYLKGAGINVEKRSDGSQNFMALTDRDITKLSRGAITSGDAVTMKDNTPIPGGLFDVGITGGHYGKAFAHIDLHEPLPNPAFEEPIRRLLGVTGKEFEELIKTEGGEGLRNRLSKINVDEEMNRQKEVIRSGRKSHRDLAVKRLGFLDGLKRSGVKPEELVWSKAPVVPPLFRPVSLADGIQLTSDANILYKDLFETNRQLKDLAKETDDVGDERMAAYNALKAVAGLGDPISVKAQEKGVAGLLTHVFGKSSPKFGLFQRRVLSQTVDAVGRANITPDPALDMDHIGIPESKAWDVYQPYIMRRLARQYNVGERGVPLTQLAKWVADRDPRARRAMLEEMEERPVIANRAPVLHRFGIMAFKPVLTPGETLRLSPVVTKPFGADFDGDQMNYQVPATDEAAKEALERMLPSKNLLSPSDFLPHMMPQQEYLMGLFRATVRNSSKPARTFMTTKDALAALKRGELDVSDPIIIHGEKPQ
jgi:DNA-directed RNA polymerase beta subunit